jgi:hypothetical protein
MSDVQNKKKWMPSKFLLLLLIPLSLYFSFGFYHIAKFETADEHYWIYEPVEGRIHDYWNALSRRDWFSTRINDKPGVMLAYVSGIGILLEDNLHKRAIEPANYQSAFSSLETERINLAFRAPLLIFNGLFALLLFWLIKRLTENRWLALMAVTLILLNPIIIGVSQIVNPDSLLWIFSFSSLLALLNYLKYRTKKDAVLSSLLLGFALLSKYSAIIFIPFFFLLTLINLLQEKNRFEFAKKAQENMLGYFLILLGSFIVFAILMPAVFVIPSFFYQGIIGFKGMAPIFWFLIFIASMIYFDARFLKSSCLFVLSKGIRWILPFLMRVVFLIISGMLCLAIANWSSIGNNFLDIKGINFDAGRDYSFRRQDFFDKLFLEIYPLVFSLTPLVLLSLIALWFKGVFTKLKYSMLVFSTTLFLIVFYVAVLKQGLLVNIRYSVMLYPILMFLAAFSFDEFFGNMKRARKLAFFFILIVASSVSLWLIRPYYFNYTSELLPKNRIITGAWGYGGYEAAQFLNALPNSKNLKVWSDYWGVCYFFNGICVQASEYDSYMSKSEENTIDYYVMTRRGEMTNSKRWKVLREDLQGGPIWSLNIDNRPKNFIRIYQAK